ncbi:hypothetical protein ASZ90_003186 [hydrocarbon metagenome]|uniref:Uncharacterized protein n=1 Tax=hydrocarbon metagenome TaxID=938273 RepID=A0A0W8G1P3_9ZZZZ
MTRTSLKDILSVSSCAKVEKVNSTKNKKEYRYFIEVTSL